MAVEDVDGNSHDSPRVAVSYTVGAVDRALSLLEALADAPDSGVTELAERTGATKSMTFRLLYTLEARGYVVKDADRRTYALGYRTMLLGDQGRRQSRLVAEAEPFLEALAGETRENALLLLREGANSVCIALHASPQPLRIFAAVGRVGPLHAGGGPKVLLAFAPEDVRRAVMAGPLPRFTDATPADPAILEAALETIRRDGVAVSQGEIDPEICSIAAPVRDHSGGVIAALSVTGPAARLDAPAQDRVRAAVRDAAARLSLRLGWRGAASLAG